MKSVQIPIELFNKLCLYHLAAPDMVDEEEICRALQKKLDALIRRQYFTESKTAETEEERAAARQKYLNSAGIF